MRFVFIVQGEGRGHLTQAISMSQLLQSVGHQVVKVLVGTAQERKLPDFFVQHFTQNQISDFRSPCLAYHHEKLSLSKTIFQALVNLPTYFKSIKQIQNEVIQSQPDIILNFYDVLAGFHQVIHRPKAPMLCIGHQYLFFHQDFQFPKGIIQRWAVNFNSQLTAMGVTSKLALSFREMKPANNSKINVVPPLLRQEIKQCSPIIASEDFLLAYATHSVLARQIVKWHQQNSSLKIHCFCSKAPQNHHPNLVFHQIDGQKFLEMMKRCRGLVCTAGFESVCEAMFFQKPVMMIPVPDHYEQACNALDGVSSGAGIQANNFMELSKFITYLDSGQYQQTNFNIWVNQTDKLILKLINDAYNKTHCRQVKLRFSARWFSDYSLPSFLATAKLWNQFTKNQRFRASR